MNAAGVGGVPIISCSKQQCCNRAMTEGCNPFICGRCTDSPAVKKRYPPKYEAAIIGGTVAGAVVLVIAGVALWAALKRKRGAAAASAIEMTSMTK